VPEVATERAHGAGVAREDLVGDEEKDRQHRRIRPTEPPRLLRPPTAARAARAALAPAAPGMPPEEHLLALAPHLGGSDRTRRIAAATLVVIGVGVS
jgi:hypothetical protein